MPGINLNHVELFVADLETWRADLVDRYAFTVRGRNANDEARSVVLSRGSCVLVLTQGRIDDHPAAVYVRQHGDGVADIAICADDLSGVYDNAVRSGARVVRAAPGVPQTAVISGVGDLVHTLVQRSPDRICVPGFGEVAVDDGATRIDHFAMCVPSGSLREVASFYERVLGLHTIFTEQIAVGDQAMNSLAAQNDTQTLTFTIIEPDLSRMPGQIDEFLKEHGGAGIQHIAFATDNIVAEVSALMSRGVQFLEAPPAYYDLPAKRHVVHRHPIELLRRLNILLDEDADGQLFQIFARSTHPRRTFFFEVIERASARTFGSGNIKALYEAVEKQRRRSSVD